MSRTDAKNFLIGLGIAEPTEEQISNYLNSVNKETQKEKEKTDKLKADADKVKELQAELDRLNDANLSEMEKLTKVKDTALTEVEALKKQIQQMQLKTSFSEIGIIGEEYDSLFKDGNIDVSALGKIISTRIETAKSDAIKEIADKADSNIGGKGSDDGEEESLDVAMAKKLTFGTPAEDVSVRDAYVLH